MSAKTGQFDMLSAPRQKAISYQVDWRSLEKSCISKGTLPRTQIYYCHPYSSWERGTNEQINGHLRRFIPKGCSISDYSTTEIQKIEDWLNNYPRKILNGQSAIEFIEGELNKCA
jgi:IS30 family transposase